MNTTHGESRRTTEYEIWAGIKKRCLNPKSSYYKDYGGRGITICERWLKYENFLIDMGRRPSSKHTLERQDNNGSYSPENCRWATRVEQANNRRSNRLFFYKGASYTLSQLARKFFPDEAPDTARSRIAQRIDRLGMTLEQAIETPKQSIIGVPLAITVP